MHWFSIVDTELKVKHWMTCAVTWFELIRRNLEKWIAEGLYREDMDAAIISRLQMARTEMIHLSDIIDEDEMSTSHFINEIF